MDENVLIDRLGEGTARESALDGAKVHTLRRSRLSWLMVLPLAFLLGAGMGYLLLSAGADNPDPVVPSKPPSAEANTAKSPTSSAGTTPRKAEAHGHTDIALQAKGHIIAERIATVSAVATARLEKLLVQPGSEVHRGQLIAQLDDGKERIAVELAESRLRVQELELAELRAVWRAERKSVERLRRLVKQNLASESELDDALRSLKVTEARIATQQANIETSSLELAMKRRELEDFKVKAPFDGVVIDTAAQAGEIISPDSAGGSFTRTGLSTILDRDSIVGEVHVNEDLIARVQSGQRVEVNTVAYAETPLQARVLKISPNVDKEKASVRVLLKLDWLPDWLKVGMRFNASFLAPEA